MKRIYTSLFLATVSLVSTFAANGSGFVGNGYYRICNFATSRYVYVTDNKDYYDLTHDKGDFQAIQLWKDINRAVPDPASVIYIEEVSSGQFDLKAQGTGVHELTGYYVGVQKQRNGTYIVSASDKGVTKYLSDDRTNDTPEGKMGTNNSGNFRKWIVDQITTTHATNYFGVKPTIELNGMYYRPFFASFPFRPAAEGMNVYCVDRIQGSDAIMKKIEGDVPASTPVIIECTSDNPSQNRLELLNSTSAKVTGNKLSGVYFCNFGRQSQSVDAYTPFDAATMRVFSVTDGKLVLTNDAPGRFEGLEVVELDEELGDWVYVTVDCFPANTSYLKTDASTPSELNVCLEGTGLNDITKKNSKVAEGVYSLSGTQLRVNNDTEGLPAGLYIVGGKKVVIK